MKDIKIYPATADRWIDLETLFGANGAYSNCWCMFWRVRRVEFNRMSGKMRKAALRSMTIHNQVPGIVAYVDGQPAGWCSIAPREQFDALEHSSVLKRVDDNPVWSIVCFFITKPHRKGGVMTALIRGAVEYAVSQGARTVEAYPIDLESHKLKGQPLKGCSGYMGIASVFGKEGFRKIRNASETQLVMRWTPEK